MNKCSWVIGNRVSASFLGLVQKGAELASGRGEELRVIIVSEKLNDTEASCLSELNVRRVFHLALNTEDINAYSLAKNAIYEQARKQEPGFILFESSVFFCTVAPGLAAMLDCGITADCTQLCLDESKRILQIRPAFGGRKLATNICTTSPEIATVRAGIYKATPKCNSEISIEKLDAPQLHPAWTLKQLFKDSEDSVPLSEADIILSGGLGLKSKENFELLFRLAKNIGAAVGASRAAVAAGYISYNHQVGQTGVSVRPAIYLAFGISGAVQHLSGIMGAKKIYAVNSDPTAQIHQYSDYSVIADCRDVLLRMLEQTEK